MTAPDPRLGEIEARLADHYEGIAYADDIPEGQDWEVPEDYERHYCNEDGEDWPCAAITTAAPADVAYLLAELRKRDDALAAAFKLAEEWRYKGEHGWGAWQEGHGPDPEGYVMDGASADLRAAISDALTGGGE